MSQKLLTFDMETRDVHNHTADAFAYMVQSRQAGKALRHADMYGSGKFYYESSLVDFKPKLQPTAKGDRVHQHLQWLKEKLPPRVYAQIGWLRPMDDGATGDRKRLELGWWICLCAP
jgi:hypothetical protein